MKLILTLLLIISMDIQFNYACPCIQANTLIEMNESFANQSQGATVFPMSLWLLLWSYPIEGLAIGLLISLIVYYRMVYSTKLFPHEKLGLILNITHKTQTPLTLIHHLLEEVVSDNLSESTSQKIKRILRYTNHIMSCYQNIAVFDDKENELHPGSSPIEFELYTFITSIVNQCRIYADTRQIKLNISKDFSYISCRVDEMTMTAALQCLLNKMIEATPCKGCINMNVSHSVNHWNLRITNGPEYKQSHKKTLSFISTFMLMHYCGSLQIIKKIIRLHGGKLSGDYHGRSITIRVTVPINGYCNTVQCPEVVPPVMKDDKIIHSDKNKQHILLVMADKELSGYLHEAFSTLFKITVVENPEQIVRFSGQRMPDIIIIDETVGGIHGKEICSKVKSNTSMVHIPVILLISANDNRSYLDHIDCGVDKLESRAINICRLKVDIQMLINKHERIMKLLEKNLSDNLPSPTAKSEEDALFINKVDKLLEKNLSTESYTVDMLSADMGMCRTKFYTKIKEITDKTPTEYMHYFKMNKAKVLLVTQQYTVTEIATFLGFCNAKYFGKQFKKFYKVPPTQYIKEVF